MLTNFTQLNTVFGVDHVTYSPAVANSGKHTKATFVETSDPATAANEIAVYSKDVGGVSRLFQRLESSGSVIPFTPIFSSQVLVGPPARTEYTLTFAGVIMKWGYITSINNNVTVSFGTAFTTSWRSLQLTLDQNLGSSVAAVIRTSSAPNAANFTVQTNQTGVGFTYFAIGD